MKRLRLLMFFLAVLVLGVSCAGYGQFLNDPTYLYGSGQAWKHDIAYNPDRNEYLVAFFEMQSDAWRKICYFRLDGNGNPIGGKVTIYDDTAGTHAAAVAYNSVNQEYLIAYTAYKAGWYGDLIYAQRVNANTGALIGSAYCIHNCTQYDGGGDREVSVAYSHTSNTYLVAWGNNGNWKVYGRLLSGSTGQPLTGDINITPNNLGAEPSICWNSAANEFYVVYQAENGAQGTGWDIAGQRVSASSGALIGGYLLIANSTAWEWIPDVEYDDINNRYLVVYGGPGYVGVWGQFVTPSNTFDGARVSMLTAPLAGGGCTFVSFQPGPREFLVTWQDQDSTDLYARRISQSGAGIGSAFKINGNIGGGVGNFEPVTAANTVSGEYLLSWSYGYTTLYTRRYLPAAAPLSPVTNFVATAGNGQNALSWTNPGPPWTGTMIRFKTNGFPTGPTDGTLIYDGAGASYTHTNLTNGVTYYYAAFAHDATPTYAAGVNASATPSATPGLLIVPQPQELTWKAGTGFTVNASTQIMANSSPDAREQNMAQQLQRKIWNTTGHLLPIVYGGSATSNVIAVGTPARCPAVNSIISTWSEASGKASKSEGYMLGVKDTSIVIRGYDDPGTFYGSQTLIQLLEYFKTTAVSPLFTYDYPKLPFRGVYLRVKWEHDWAFTKELLSEMIARYKCNYFSPEIHMVSVSHPEISPPNENPVLLASAQDMLNFTALHYMNNIVTWYPGPPQEEPQPEQCWLDPAWIQKRADLFNDNWNYLGNPPLMHCHESEISVFGCAAERSQYSNEWLYNNLLWQDWDQTYVTHGVQPVIWSDMLRPDMMGGSQGTANVVATMPDMILADWEYGSPSYVPTDYPSLDRWIQYGRKAVATPYGVGSFPAYSQYYGDKENIYYWANAVYNRRGSYPNLMLGMLAWNKFMARNRHEVVGSSTDNLWQQQNLGCYPYYAEWAWNPNGRYWNPYPYGNGWSMVARQIAPARVSGFSATRSGSNNNLSWTNPSDSSFTGTYIVYRNDRFPTSPLDGTYVASVSGSPGGAGSYSHVGGPSVAYYAAFAHDNVRKFSPSATSVVGVAIACYQEPFSYSNGALVGQGGWTGTATSSQIAINNGYLQMFGGSGAGQAMKAVSCVADGSGYITVTCKINGEVGGETMWNLLIDGADAYANFARWYGSGTTVRGRIGGTGLVTAVQNLSGGWEELKVKIHPVNNTTEFFFNGNSIGIFDHSVTGVGDVVQGLRFERVDNSYAAGHNLFFDDLVIGEVTPPDTTPPGPVTNFVATPGTSQISLSWTNPGDADFAGTMIRFSTAGYPGSPTGGTQVYNGTGTSTVHSGLTSGVTYYYSAFTYDGVPNYSAAVTVSGVPSGDTTPPGNVTNFTATAGNGQNGLSWTNPGDGDFAGVKIMFKTNGYPTGPTDGTQCYNGSGTSTTHTGLTNGVTYYYKAFAYDAVPNYASGAQASATPASGFCFQDEFIYPDGALVGQGGWTGNATSSHIQVIGEMVKVHGGSGARNATKTINCDSSPSGLIYVRMLAYRGIGDATMWDVWINDTTGKNIARWYGTGTTARGRIGGSGLVTGVQNLRGGGLWDSLNVIINPTAKTSQFYYNGGDIGTFSYSSTGAGNVVGQIVIERTNNNGASGHHMFLDDIRVSPY